MLNDARVASLVSMSGHVKESETAKILQLYATSRSTSVSTRLKMTIFIIFSSQKTRGRVAGNLSGSGKSSVVTRYPYCATVASRMDRALHSVVRIYLRAACLLRRSCTKIRALIYVENVNKDQNCDW